MPYRAFLLGCKGGDLRWPYLAGNPNDEDGLHLCDVRRMRDALKARGYESVEVVPEGQKEGDIVDLLNEATRACTSGDTFLFYFSGHTRGAGGVMRLVLGERQGHKETLSATTLIEKLQTCKAASKLIVLDCCYAGDLTEVWEPKIYDNLQILAATDRATPAGEFDELQGGIFTYFLCQALTACEHWVTGDAGVIDEEGNIWSDKLSGWLKKQVVDYAQAKGRQVGEPLQYVLTDRGKVCIARVQPRDWPEALFAGSQLNDLLALLEKADLPAAVLHRYFNDLLDGIQPAYEWPRPVPPAPPRALVDYLADMGIRQANVPAALLEYTSLLADEVADGKDLRAWTDQVADRLLRRGELSRLQREALGSSRRALAARPPRPFSLLIVPGQPDKEKWDTYANGGAWLDTGDDEPPCVAALDTEIGAGGIPGLIREALDDERVAGRLRRGETHTHLTLEIFLPRGLLAADPDDWTPWPSDPDVPTPGLCYHYNLLVRPWERIAPPGERCWTEGWEQSWGLCGDCRARGADDPACVDWLAAPVQDYGTRLGRGACLFVLKSPPEPPEDPVRLSKDLARPLVHGVAKFLWCDVPLAEDLEKRLRTKMKGRRLSELPDVLREVRAETWVESGEQDTGRLHLLWDDPNRKPRIWIDPGSKPATTEPPPRLVSAYDQFST